MLVTILLRPSSQLGELQNCPYPITKTASNIRKALRERMIAVKTAINNHTFASIFSIHPSITHKIK